MPTTSPKIMGSKVRLWIYGKRASSGDSTARHQITSHHHGLSKNRFRKIPISVPLLPECLEQQMGSGDPSPSSMCRAARVSLRWIYFGRGTEALHANCNGAFFEAGGGNTAARCASRVARASEISYSSLLSRSGILSVPCQPCFADTWMGRCHRTEEGRSFRSGLWDSYSAIYQHLT
jgi:hypothetical protein